MTIPVQLTRTHTMKDTAARIFVFFTVVLLLGLQTLEATAGGGGGARGGSVHVRGYTKSNGTYVAPHYRSAPDGNFGNNWSTLGNVNPYTGEPGTKVTPPSGYGSSESKTPYHPDTPAISSSGESGRTGRRASNGAVRGIVVLPESDHAAAARRRDVARAQYWKEKGYVFNPEYMSSYAMDQKARDIDRAGFWSKAGYSFDAEYMSAYAMDQKVKDIRRAGYWKTQGYSFDADYMSAYAMDQKVKDIQRAAYWKTQGYRFDPDYMSAYAMDQKVKDIVRAKYWKERGYDFDADYMSAYAMDSEAGRARAGR